MMPYSTLTVHAGHAKTSLQRLFLLLLLLLSAEKNAIFNAIQTILDTPHLKVCAFYAIFSSRNMPK